MIKSGWHVRHVATIGSTMDAARALANDHAPDRTVVRSDEQTGGRGRYGRNWRSDVGNLYMTVLLRETRSYSECAPISFVAALALADAIDDARVSMKWPNDVLLNGQKTAGILLEVGGDTASPWILIGMGTNVAHHPEGTTYPATHLNAHLTTVELNDLFERILSALDRWRAVWHGGGSAPIFRTWLDRAHGVGDRIEVRLQEQTMSGVFETLDEEGRLVLRLDDDRVVRISAGDVFPLGAA